MNYLIIGGNATGMSAASRLRRNMPDVSITVLEKGEYISFGACGLPYFIAGEFDDPKEMLARSLESFQKMNINVLINHEALSIDHVRKKVNACDLSTKETVFFSYDKVVISTGASPILPNIKGIQLSGIHTLTKMEDGIVIKEALEDAQNIVILGAGFIGLEVAEAMIHQGKNVTIIEMESRVSSRVFDSEMTEYLEKSLIEHGVHLCLSETVIEFFGIDKVDKVITNKGEYKADLVIVAAGFIPETKWCSDIGLEMFPNGAILIDNQGKTNLQDIYAGGDCATINRALYNQSSYIPLATNANKLGRILGDVLAGIPNYFPGCLGSSALRFMDFQIARTGLSEYEAKKIGIIYSVNLVKDFNHTNYVAGRSELYMKYIYETESRILIGAQICGGKDAVLRIDALVVAIYKKATVDEIGMMDFVYAPPFSRTWDILNIGGNTSK